MLVIGAVISSSVAGYACQNTPTEARNAGVEAQREADQKISEANKQAAEKVAQANREGAAATDEAQKAAMAAQAEANEKIRETNRIVAGERDETRSWGQKAIDSVDSMIDTATTHVQTGTPKAKALFNAAIAGVKQQRDVLHTELAALETHAGEKLVQSKTQFTERVDRIKLDIRNIEKSN
jgi:uncharacterized protein YPO0396